jgi:hypothetical protein
MHELIKNVGSTGSLLDKKHARKYCVLNEETKKGARLEHTTEITDTPCRSDQHFAKSPEAISKLLKIQPY